MSAKAIALIVYHDIMALSFIVAGQVLDHFRGRFIAEMDAKCVIMDLLHKNIISRSVTVTISQTNSPREQNEYLHYCLTQTCTDNGLESACQIISEVKGNSKMVALGKDMLRYLESGKCCNHTSLLCHPTTHVCICGCVRNTQANSCMYKYI